MAAIAFNDSSCRAIALAIGVTRDIKISRVAVWRFLRKKAIVVFLEKIVAHALKQSIASSGHAVLKIAENSKQSVKGIGRILIGDATTICLHDSLSAIFPGARNQTEVRKAQLKIQLIVDLLTGQFVDLSLDPYQRSDAKAAFDFIPKLQAGDLLIRDLGYSCMKCFKAIIASNAYFISRLTTRVHVFDGEGEKLKLVERLLREAPHPGDMVRIPILIGADDQVPCELIAIRVPEEVANQRRSKLQKKHKKQGWSAPSKEYLARQNWTLLVTNLPEENADNQKIRELYLMRWRIEIIFKACKSHSGLLKIAGHKTNENHAKALLLTWLLLMMILARRGTFSMARLREVICPKTHESYHELEVHNQSLIKSVEKHILMLGFHIELLGCGKDLSEHSERTLRYEAIHNQTELKRRRRAQSQVLKSVLELENKHDLC